MDTVSLWTAPRARGSTAGVSRLTSPSSPRSRSLRIGAIRSESERVARAGQTAGADASVVPVTAISRVAMSTVPSTATTAVLNAA